MKFNSLNLPQEFIKLIVKRFKPVLSRLDIEKDFLEISTEITGVRIQLRFQGKETKAGDFVWDAERIVNQSIIPTQALVNFKNN